MKTILKLEEAAQLLLSIFLFYNLDFSWWVFPACILLPDLSMIGYAFGNKIGAYAYNLFHHKFVGIAILILGYWIGNQNIVLVGLVLFGHAAMDRIFGYGLKYKDNFKHTHLGWIGKKNND